MRIQDNVGLLIIKSQKDSVTKFFGLNKSWRYTRIRKNRYQIIISFKKEFTV